MWSAPQSLRTSGARSLALGINTTVSSNRSTLIASPAMNHEPISEEFKSILHQNTRTAISGQPFVLVEKLQHWLRSPVDRSVTHAERLVRVAYKDRPTTFSPITAPHIIFDPGDSCCLLVFCILELIGCGSAVDTFHEHQKTDRLLPMRLDTIQQTFRSAKIQDSNKASEFFKLQHRFKPARFEWQMKKKWDSDTVIPICQKNLIKKGGTAQIYQIDIPEEFVDQSLRHYCAGSRFNAASEESPEWVCCRPILPPYAPWLAFLSLLITIFIC